MKVLNVCSDDWANFSYDNMMALRSVGIDCDSVKLNTHDFYSEQSGIVPLSYIKSHIKNFDTIQFFHDNINLFNEIMPFCLGKKVIAYHTSSVYRKNHVGINAEMNRYNVRHVVCMPEFMSLCHGAVYMVGAVDTDKFAKVKTKIKKPYKFAHYPSNPKVKGTDKIIELMGKTKADFVHSVEQVSYEDQIKRMSECDIYVELYSKTDGNGMPYGNFGITALEAAAMGKVVLTQLTDQKIYREVYGAPCMAVADSDAGFVLRVRGLLGMEPSQLKAFQKMSRAHVVRHHGYKASGEYILKNIINDI